MTLNQPRVREKLKAFDFQKLFVEELGWDRHASTLTVPINGTDFSIHGFAQKRGVQVFECLPGTDGQIPAYDLRRKIDREVTKSAAEHLTIFVDADKSTQIWQWVARQAGQPAAFREHIYHPNSQTGDGLIQKLAAISIPLSEEEAIDLTGTIHRLRDAFDRDRVTKRFYERFQAEHKAFLGFIQGLTDQGDRDWYASLMLNRLMFIYFIQKKGFLDGNPNYLRDRLAQVQSKRGKGKFQTFYRYFLLCLFHEGFAKQPGQRTLSADLASLLGTIPYLNGGLFDEHELERKYDEKIDVPDEAFDRLFKFFEGYEWHLDTRPLSTGREINPDVLGYIFEKYINQKQMGAYYTKEDITGYISQNTIIPFLFDAAEKKCAVAFQPNSAMWRQLKDNPDRYIYSAVRHGVIDDQCNVFPLPAEIQKGVGDVAKRGGWNRSASAPFALPTETWREHVARRQRCLELREKLAAGEIHTINDLITWNLDIRQFAVDTITDCEGPELVRAFYQAIQSVSVLDPTCGSGAFLFAALNILEPMYEACLDRMEAFIDDLSRSGTKHSPKKFDDFRKILADVARHPNRSYFILKSIIVHNLFGVDIMEEAVEICKLRLFLKLVSQIESATELEPLPDIDFNIRAGNTLVGFARLDDVRKAMANRLDFGNEVQRIEEEAEVVARAYSKFREMQTAHGMDGREFASAKATLRERLDKLTDELDQTLAGEYGVTADKPKKFAEWEKSHQPFHWFAEFYGIIARGGFDVIIGNPPYIVFTESKVPYRLLAGLYTTLSSKNLYVFVFERSFHLGSAKSRIGLIVQLSVLSSEKMDSFQDLLVKRGVCHAVSFPRRPESIFDGVEMPVTILLSTAEHTVSQFVTTRVCRFYTAERTHAIQCERFTAHSLRQDRHRIAKIGTSTEIGICSRLEQQQHRLGELTRAHSTHFMYYQEACRYWLKAMMGKPFFKRNGERIDPPHGRTLGFISKPAAAFVTCLCNSSLFYWYYSAFSDCEHVNDSLIRRIQIPEDWEDTEWIELHDRLKASLKANSKRKVITTRQGHTIEYDEMKALLSKPVIDDVDRALAKHFGFSGEELDFIVNYDIKYRLGADENADEAE